MRDDFSWQPDTPPAPVLLYPSTQLQTVAAAVFWLMFLILVWVAFSSAFPLCHLSLFYFWRNFMYFYGRLLPLPLGPENGNRKLLLIMLLTLCCSYVALLHNLLLLLSRPSAPQQQQQQTQLYVGPFGSCDNVRFC